MATKTKKADKKSHEEALCVVNMHGVYYSINPHGNNVLANYELPVQMRVKDVESAQAIFSNDLAPILMPRKYPDFKKLKSYHVRNVELPEGIDKTIPMMSREELCEYVEENGMECYVAMYPDIEQLRAAIIEEEANPEQFRRNQDERRKLYGEAIATKSDILALNGIDIAVEGPPPLVMPSPNPVPPSDLVGVQDDEDVDVKKPINKKKDATKPPKVDDALGF